MYNYHKILFDYSEFLNGTDIKKIEIIEIGNGEQTIPLKSSINFIYALDVPTTILMTHQKKIINLQREESYIAEQSDQTIS